ncbi:MAG: DUF2298 domain-containing protein [Kiritimatiellia bacterium]
MIRIPIEFSGQPSSRLQIFIHFLLICLCAFLLRHTGWNWDEGQHLHPDERHLSMVTQALETPETWSEYLDSDRSGFNPYRQGVHSYVYGLLPLRLVHALTVEKGNRNLQEIARIGRLCSAWWSTGTVALMYLLGLRLYSARFAALSALLMCFCVLSIQQAHFFTVDSAGVFFTMACTGLGLLALYERAPWLIAPSAATVGLAMACRLNLGLLSFWVVGVACASLWQHRNARPLWALLFGGLTALLLFRIFQPNAFDASGWIPRGLHPLWIRDLQQVRRISDGSLEVPFTLQWAGRIPWLYPLGQMVIWGMGVPLGLASLYGSAALLWHRRGNPGHWQVFVVLWPLLLFGLHGGMYLQTLRYFLPAYPMLILGALLAIRHFIPGNYRRILHGILLGGSVLYATGFVSMYRQPHPRIAASQWLYRNLAAGGRVVSEHWDDALPLYLPGHEQDHRRISFSQLEVYSPETPEKIEALLTQIQKADYLVLSSTRASHTLPSMPLRYPAMTEFYRRLDLDETPSGLREVARFSRQPQILGWTLDSLLAEEAFRVYDHPLVRIYEKTPTFNVETLRKQLTENVDFSSIPAISYREANRGNQGWLNPAQLERHRHSGPGWKTLFPENSLGNRSPLLIWGLLLWALAPLSFPFTFFFFPSLRDRGWAVSRLCGLLCLSLIAWWPAAVEWIPFGSSLLIASMAFAAASAVLWTFHADKIWKWFKRNPGLLLWNEGILWGVFFFFLALRILQPDLWHPWAGGEKPMDFAFLNATALTPYFPPPQPWLSGSFLNYYYFGFVLFASLIRISGVSPDLAYNLALPTCAMWIAGAALSLSMIFYPGFRIRKGWRAWRASGFLAVLFVLFCGNLGQVREFLKPGKLPFLRDVYWNASRVIQGTAEAAQPITEFPLFSLLYGDLHAHLMALPVAMLCLLCSWQLSRRFHPIRVLICGALLGSLQMINAWDFPVQFLIFLFCLFAGNGPLRTPLRDLWGKLGWALCGLISMRLLTAPYHWRSTPFPVRLEIWEGPHSSFRDLLLAHGQFLIPLLFAAWILWKKRPLRAASFRSRLLPGLLVAGCVFLIGFVEFFSLKDDVGRMNTVFKFYFQVWWILAVLSAVIVPAAIRIRNSKTSRTLYIVCILLLSASLLYTFTGIPAKIRDRYWNTGFRGLDGLAYMNDAVWMADGRPLALVADRAAIAWLRKNAPPFSVIMEAQRPEYQWGGRISWHTGHLSVLGWSWHMRQQRSWPGGDVPVMARLKDIRKFYSQADLSVARKYNVDYVIIGDLERITYGEAEMNRLSALPEMELLFEKTQTRIYRLNTNK